MKNDNGDYCYIDERGEIVVFDVKLSTVSLVINGLKIPTNEYLDANKIFLEESIKIINKRFEIGEELKRMSEEEFYKKYLIAEG